MDFRQILGVAEGEKEDLEGWRGFLRHLKDRGLKGVQLIISDACRGLVEAAAEVVSQDRLAALRGAFLSQRVQPRAERQSRRSRAHAQGDPRPGGSCGGWTKAKEIVRAEGDEAQRAAELVEQKAMRR